MTSRTPFLIGLTGSIGMGKSTTAKMFAKMDIPVWDADAAVHRLYGLAGAAVRPMAALHPKAVIDGQVDRGILKNWIALDPTALQQIEQIVHPLVAADRQDFLNHVKGEIVVLDIPLLFETGGETQVDLVVVTSAPSVVQRARVLARPGMTEERFIKILSNQMADSEKRARADFIIPTETLEGAGKAVHELLEQVRKTLADA